MFRLVYDPEVTMLLQSNLIEEERSFDALSYAMRAWDFLMDQRRITPAVVKTLHRMLMEAPGLSSPLEDRYRGEFRDRLVYIGGHAAVNPAAILPMLDQVFAKMNERRHIPVSDGAREMYTQRAHIEYEKIHPFMDGNGRTGRMLYNWHRIALGLPVHVIKYEDRGEYYGWFERKV